jgi:hypothetical protein
VEWLDCAAAAGRFVGYTMSSTTPGGGSVASMGDALHRATTSFTQLAHDGAWSAIERWLLTLAPAGVKLLGFQHVGPTAREQGFHVLAVRTPQWVDVTVEQSFVPAFTHSLEALGPLLPSFKLTPDAVTAATSLAQAAELTDPVLAAGLGIVLPFAQGHGKVKAVVVVAAGHTSDAFVARWQATDLVSEPPITGPWVVEWLWDVTTNAVHASGHSSLERADRTLLGGPDGWRNAVQSVCPK